MNETKQIQKALHKIMTHDEVNTCQVWKSCDKTTHGWWYKPSGEIAHPLGTTIQEALNQIENLHLEELDDEAFFG